MDTPGSGHQLPDSREFRRLFGRILGPENAFYKVVVVYSVAISLLTLAIPLSVQMLIDSVANTGLFSAVLTIGLMLFVLLLLSGVLYALRAWTMELFSRRLFSRISGEIAMTGLLARTGWFEQGTRSALFNRFFDIMTLKKNIPYILSNGFTLLLQMAIGFVVVSFYHFYFFLFSLCLILLLVLIWKTWGWKAITSAFELSSAKHETAAWLQGFAVNNAFFKTRQSSEYALARTDALVREHIAAQSRHFGFSFRQLLGFLLLCAVASAVLLTIGGWLVIMGELTLGQLVAAELIMSAIFYALPQISGYLDYYYDVCAAAEELYRLQYVETESSHLASRQQWPESADLRLESVRIDSGAGECLFDLVLPAGTAAIAQAGSGLQQDIFCRLLRREVEGRSGAVLLGEVDLSDCNEHDLRGKIRVLNRQTLVPMTIRDYLRMHGAHVTPALMHRTLVQVELADELEKLPKGLDSELGYSGAPLLLDQALRLKLAHALIGRARVLVLTQIFDCLPAAFLDRFIAAWRADGGTLLYFTRRADLRQANARLTLDAGAQRLETIGEEFV